MINMWIYICVCWIRLFVTNKTSDTFIKKKNKTSDTTLAMYILFYHFNLLLYLFIYLFFDEMLLYLFAYMKDII